MGLLLSALGIAAGLVRQKFGAELNVFLGQRKLGLLPLGSNWNAGEPVLVNRQTKLQKRKNETNQKQENQRLPH
jgi:hypothetical protein